MQKILAKYLRFQGGDLDHATVSAAASFAGLVSDLLNGSPLLVKRLLAAHLRVAPSEDDDDDEAKESDLDEDMAPTRSGLYFRSR